MDLLAFYRSTIGKKIVVALTGLMLVGFVIGHMAGNLKAFGGVDANGVHKLDHYAEFLRSFGQDMLGHGGFLWIARIGLLFAVILHIVAIIQLRSLNKRARPQGYHSEKKDISKLAVNLMFVGGLSIAAFIVFHLLHLTFGAIHPSFQEGKVFHNIIVAFKNPLITLIYIVVMAFLGLHLYHGVWSVFQTLGLNRPRYDYYIRLSAKVIACVVSFGFMIVPLAILFGFLSA